MDKAKGAKLSFMISVSISGAAAAAFAVIAALYFAGAARGKYLISLSAVLISGAIAAVICFAAGAVLLSQRLRRGRR